MLRVRSFTVCILCLVAVSMLMPISSTAAALPGPTQPDQAHRAAADALLQRIWDAQPGQPQFEAVDGVVQAYKSADSATKNAIAWVCLTYMEDAGRDLPLRWPCCYVLSGAEYQPAAPHLIELLLNDPAEAMRAVAAEALGTMYKKTGDKSIHDALLQAVRNDKSKWVRDTVAKYLGKEEIDPLPNPPDEAHRRIAEALLLQVFKAQTGQPQFDAIDAVVAKYKASDAATKSAISWLCLTYMEDRSREIPYRWPCCYVLSRGGYEPAIPHLIELLLNDQAEAIRAVAAEALGGIYKSTGDKSIRDALLQALRADKSKWVRETISRYITDTGTDPVQGTPDDAHLKAADALLQQIWDAQEGQPKFDAVNVVVQKYFASDAKTRGAIAWLCLSYMKDQNRAPLDRWPCCYVLSRSRYEAGIPDLIAVLLQDPLEAMRAVAAEALGGLYQDTRSTKIRDALMQAARTESSKWVRDTIARYLGNQMPGGN